MSMSWIQVASCMILFASLVVAAPKAKPQPPKDPLANGPAGHPTRPSAYKNAEHGLQIQLPAGWAEGGSSIPGSVVVLFPPGEKDGSVNLFHRDPGGKDIDGVLAQLQSEIKSHDANAKIDPTEDAKLGGEPARAFTYRVTLGGVEKSSLMFAAMHEGKAYVFMYGAPPAEYDKDVAAVKRVIGSLKRTKPPGAATTKPAA